MPQSNLHAINRPKEEGSEFRDEDYNPFSVGSPRVEQIEEDELARAFKSVNGHSFGGVSCLGESRHLEVKLGNFQQ